MVNSDDLSIIGCKSEYLVVMVMFRSTKVVVMPDRLTLTLKTKTLSPENV